MADRDALALLRIGLDPSRRPAGTDDEYRDLVARARRDTGFLREVYESAAALGLRVLTVDERVGLVLEPDGAGSPFAVGVVDGLMTAGHQSRPDMRAVYGLAVAAAVAWTYPDADTARAAGGQVLDDEIIDRFLRDVAERIAADPPASGEGDDAGEIVTVRRACDLVLALPSVERTKSARGGDGPGPSALKHDCTRYVVRRTLEWMADAGLLRRRNDGRYGPRERFRLMAASAVSQTALQLVSAADPRHGVDDLPDGQEVR